MLRKLEPQSAPVPGVASCTSRIGLRLVMVYEMRSTVPPPASQITKLHPVNPGNWKRVVEWKDSPVTDFKPVGIQAVEGVDGGSLGLGDEMDW